MWQIDKDYGHEQETKEGVERTCVSRVGVGRTEPGRDAFEQKPRFRFVLRDEDGVTHFGGWYDEGSIGLDECEEASLESAWEFGRRDTGATECELKREDAIRFGLWREDMGGGEWVSVFG